MLPEEGGRVTSYRDNVKVVLAVGINGRILEIYLTPAEARTVAKELINHAFVISGTHSETA